MNGLPPSLMNIRPYAAECLGTFFLALLVHLSIGGHFPVATPVIAGLTLGLVVYMLGGISGAHVNPAVTIGLASIGKISWLEAGYYVLAQLLGGFLAFLAGGALLGGPLPVLADSTLLITIAEALGAAILVLGVSSVVHGKAPHDAAGLTIGTALTLGAFAASVQSNGVLNPAVAFGIGSLSVAYVLGPILGGIIAAQAYKALVR